MILIEYWWYNTLTRENNGFLNVLVRLNFATPTPFGSVSCFVVGVHLSNYNLNSVLRHQASYSKGYQSYLMHREVLGSIWKIGRYPIKVSEVLVLCFVVRYLISILILQSSWWGRESWFLCLVCLPGVLWCLCGSSSRCHGFVCGLWLWYILIILTYYFLLLRPNSSKGKLFITCSTGVHIITLMLNSCIIWHNLPYLCFVMQ